MSLDHDIETLLGPAPHEAGPVPAVPRVPLPRGTAGEKVSASTHYPTITPLRGGFGGGGAYDGASRFDRSLALWQPGLGSADLDVLLDQPAVEARSRDSLRNDAYVASGRSIHQDSIVGDMFMLNAKPSGLTLGLDEVWEKEFQEEVETKFTLWAESPNNWMDASRMNTLTSMVRLVVGLLAGSDEVLATAEWMRDGRPYNTAVQMVDIDRLSTPMGQWNNEFMRGGVERDRFGAPIAYNIRTRHPADFGMFSIIPSWKRVPIRKPWGRLQVIHIIEQLRPDQTRGISAMVSALKEIRITKKFRDTVLQNAVMNASFAATIESDLPGESVFAQLGGGNLDEVAMRDAIEHYATSYMGAIAEYGKDAKNMALDGVKIPHLFPGTKLQMRPAGPGGPLGSDFEKSLLRYIASALGVSYEQLSKDYSQTNYSSIRAAVNETGKHMRSRKKFGADRFASAVFRLWLEEAFNKGDITSMSAKAPPFYEGLNADAYTQCDWIGAGRGQVDELKETQAAIQRILFGLSTWEDELGRFGKDWRKVFAQIQREQEERNQRKILQNVGSDMANATTGATRNKEPGEGETDVGEEATTQPAGGGK
jgi:lambda family phage portal protein